MNNIQSLAPFVLQVAAMHTPFDSTTRKKTTHEHLRYGGLTLQYLPNGFSITWGANPKFYYWKFLEYGTIFSRKHEGFIRHTIVDAIQSIADALGVSLKVNEVSPIDVQEWKRDSLTRAQAKYPNLMTEDYLSWTRRKV